MKNKRAEFTSKFGVIAAAAGSAIGLGNIWKFPYITGVYGGAAFLFVYLGFILAIGSRTKQQRKFVQAAPKDRRRFDRRHSRTGAISYNFV